MSKSNTIVIRGTLHWAKVIGDARPYTGNPKYDKGPYWSVDVTPDAKSRKILEEYKLDSKLRDPSPTYEKETRTESFISLRVLENRPDGKKNNPPKIIAPDGTPWGNELLGNETVADVKINVVDYGRGSEKGTYLQAIRVLKHVPYESSDFAPLSESDEFWQAPEKADTKAKVATNEDDLDDSIPF